MAKRSWLVLGFAVVASMLAACGGSGGSCRPTATGGSGETCIDFVAGYSSTSAMELCGMSSGATYSASACATNNRVGRCTQSSPDGAFTQVLNFYGPTTQAQAMAFCTTAGGSFTAN